MSTTQQLASAVEALTQVKTAFDAQKALIQTKFTEYQSLLNSAVAAVPNMKKFIYVDAVNGSDENSGSPESPLATLDTALSIAANNISGYTDILLSPGVYDAEGRHNIRNSFVRVIGDIGRAEETIIRSPSSLSCLYIYSSYVELNYVQIVRTGEDGEGNLGFVILYSSAASFGSWRNTDEDGLTSPTNYTFKYSSEVSPLFKTERGFGHTWIERAYIEGTGDEPLEISNTRNQTFSNHYDLLTSNANYENTILTNIILGE